jgi:hypothetical protein
MRIDELQSLAVDRTAIEVPNAGRSTRMHNVQSLVRVTSSMRHFH